MPEYIMTVGDIRLALGHLSGDSPIQFSLDGVVTKAYFLSPGVEGGDATIIVEPNYTVSGAPPAPLPTLPEHEPDEPDDGLRPVKR